VVSLVILSLLELPLSLPASRSQQRREQQPFDPGDGQIGGIAGSDIGNIYDIDIDQIGSFRQIIDAIEGITPIPAAVRDRRTHFDPAGAILLVRI